MDNIIVDKEYIENFTEENLWQLTKVDLEWLAKEWNIELKKRDSKDTILKKIKSSDKFNLINIYNMFSNYYFGLYPTVAQKLLNVDNATLKKLSKKGFIDVAYTRQDKMYGKYVDVPYYKLKDLQDRTKEGVENAIKEYCKPATKKQLEALEKAREVSILNRTCTKCGSVVGLKNNLRDGLCYNCIIRQQEEEQIEAVRQEFKCILKNKENYVILDTETTGLDQNLDEIIEIAIVDMDGNALLNTRTYTDVEISLGAAAVHGISKEDLVGKPTIKELNPTIGEIIKDKIVLIYNAKFDVGMLRNSGYKGPIESECLMEMYMNYCNSERWIGLQRAMEYEDIDIIQDHSAYGDCLCCLELIKKVGGLI